MNLTQKKCVPCEAGGPPLNAARVRELAVQIDPAWRVVSEKQFARDFTFADFVATMAFVNKIAALAEQEGHHPNLHIFFNKLTVELWTHAVGGLSENDFILASKIDTL